MRYTLKDYQRDAAKAMLDNFEKARRHFRDDGDNVAFSLSATTGAGKTVIAAAVIEALFVGSEEFDFEADPTAVVLWFTHDPALNEQTRFKLNEAADQLNYSRLIPIENDFNQKKLAAGNVYFLNAQKLSRNAMLVRGDSPVDQDQLTGYRPMPDERAFTMWETIGNTIADESLTLYLILDEAHHGMRRPSGRESEERQTIVRRLVNGGNGVPPVPVVWGISATIDRFTDAMAMLGQDRNSYKPFVVDPALIQESGLLKDDIILDFPAEAGAFDTVLLKRGVLKIKRSSEEWAEYLAGQDEPVNRVVPLLVVQLPNKPSAELLNSAIGTIFEAWPELERDSVAHVFGEHKPLNVRDLEIPHIPPERVQDATHVRVLLAKDAVSTGWDCPRAEVLVSFRPAKDQTHITQLLGRMVRTPLARRVEGNDALNSVECVLPKFDQLTATAVAEAIVGHRGDDTSDGTGGGEGRRVLMAPADYFSNAAVPGAVWDAFDSLATQTLPRSGARPTRRLLAFAQELSRDGIRKGARGQAIEELMDVLDGFVARHKKKIEELSEGILKVEGETIVARVGGSGREVQSFIEAADDRVVAAEYRVAAQVLTPDLARNYTERIAVEEDGDDGLFDARLTVSSLAQVDVVKDDLDAEANKMFNTWYDSHRVDLMELPDARQSRYSDVIAMSNTPESINIRRPVLRREDTLLKDGSPAPVRSLHLLADSGGEFPVGSLNEWELPVLDAELARSNVLAWYRNPSRGSEDSLAIAYEDENGDWRRLCPDFIFFHGDASDVKVSIVDPHGYHLADAMPKLRGLARFAGSHEGSCYHRIEAVAQLKDGQFRVLDLKDDAVRAEIDGSESVEAVYQSNAARDYITPA
jgi:hypothetical protein